MKKTLLLTISACLVYLSGLAQTCGTGGIVLNSQAQVNAFETTYPGCPQVVEGLEVTGADITNLSGLGSIKSHLKIDATDRNQAFSIRDAQGTTVMEASVLPSHDLDTSTLQNGLYLLSVGEETFKVLVQH